jgi:hypothetical protein
MPDANYIAHNAVCIGQKKMSNANYIGRNALCIALPKFTPGSWALIYVNFGVVIYSPGGKLPGEYF